MSHFSQTFKDRASRFWCIVCASPLLLLACSGQQPAASHRSIILGFDGMDPVLTRQMMDQGLLPNFTRLAQQGHFAPLATTQPPQSPVAWSSFATGTTPGEHGIYDFLRRDPSNYQPDFSIAQTIRPDSYMPFFGLQIPLNGGQVINRRQGQTFWSDIEAAGERATILRVPVTYPPEPVFRMVSGMGVPDLLGTQGTYSYYSTRPMGGDSANAQLIRLKPDRTGRIETVLTGPGDPVVEGAPALTLPLVITPAGQGVQIELDVATLTLQPGDWSPWIPVSFRYFMFSSMDGMVRFQLQEGYPEVSLYMTPIHIDPLDPAIPVTQPADYSEALAEQIGRFHTIGMPEETWSLSSGHLSDEAFLEVIAQTLAEREAMLHDALDRHDSELVVAVFVQTDRVSHMFYRGIDPEHPLHAETSAMGRQAIEWIYREADRILGETMDRMSATDRLLVVSDHGFAPFRRAVNLNRWLIEQGYQVLLEGANPQDPGFVSIDWSKTRAYAVGLNGLFINRAGREQQGIVTDEQLAPLLSELAAKLLDFKDPRDATPVIKQVHQGGDLYPNNANADAPDLLVGYHRGYRASWQTALGAAGDDLVHDNSNRWSGDHCIAADEVPGILFSSHPADEYPEAIGDVAGWVRSLHAH